MSEANDVLHPDKPKLALTLLPLEIAASLSSITAVQPCTR